MNSYLISKKEMGYVICNFGHDKGGEMIENRTVPFLYTNLVGNVKGK